MANAQIEQLKTILNADSVQKQFIKALGSPEKANNFAADIVTMSSNTNLLSKCSPTDVVSLCSKAALLNLSFSKGEAFILPFKEKDTYKATFIPSAKGWMQLAYRTGKYTFINSEVVYEGEIKSYNRFTKEVVWGEKKSDKVVGYYATFKVLSSTGRERPHSDYWTLEYMAKYAKHYSPSIKYDHDVTVESLIKAANNADQFGLGWVNNFNAMAKKTILTHLLNHEGDFTDSKMQFASTLEVEAFKGSRDEQIANNANTETIEETEAVLVNENPEPQQQETENNTKAPFEE